MRLRRPQRPERAAPSAAPSTALRTLVALGLVLAPLSLVPGAATGRQGATPSAARQPVAAAHAPQRPNILLITTDDQTDTDLDSMPRTRRLLARQGVNFVEAISPHPLCCPARAEIFTGEYAQNNGVKHNDGPFGGYQRFSTYRDGRNLRANLGAWLHRAGYRTGFTGKMLNGYTSRSPVPRGWDWWDPTVAGTYAYYGSTFYNDGRPVHPDGYVTDVLADRATRFIRSSARHTRPFFLWASHVAPHDAIVGGRTYPYPLTARRHDRLFRDAVPPAVEKPSFNEKDVSDKPRYFGIDARLHRADMVRAHVRRLRSLAAVDEANAAMVRALRRSGELDSTLVVFTSDNGFLLGEHRLRGKNFPYVENLQVPLLMSGPGVPRGTTSRALAETVDLAPTLLDAAGALEPLAEAGRVDGSSLLPAAQATADRSDAALSDTALVQAGTKRHEALEHHDGWMFRGVYTSRYTYVAHYHGQGEMYDRDEDPFELRNLLAWRTGTLRRGAQEYAEVLAALRERLRVLQTCRGPARCDRDFDPLPKPQGS